MFINQDVIDNTVAGLSAYISYITNDYLNSIIIKDNKERELMDKSMYAGILKRSLNNYDYDSEYMTDDEVHHLLEQAQILTNELPDNSIYGGK
jgi:hypothetical protein